MKMKKIVMLTPKMKKQKMVRVTGKTEMSLMKKVKETVTVKMRRVMN